MAVEASPALSAALPIAEDSPVVSENSVQEHRVPGKPLPPVAAHVSTPLPAAVTRTEATLPVDAPAPTTVAPPAVPEQIVSAVVPLHGRGDGRHEVTLELRPEDLGTIRVEVLVEQQTVHLTLHATEPATARLLSAALAELRTALADAGLRAGDLAVGPDGGSSPGRRSRPGPPPGEKAADDSATPAGVRPVRPSAAGRLDLLL
jgi:flagellar hook-length control protein FliK